MASAPWWDAVKPGRNWAFSTDALEDLELAVSLDPENAEAHTKRGNVHRERGDLDLAVGAYDRALFLEGRVSRR